jgi:inosine-uridine nucleoside N-ribohydrolase
MQKTNALRLLDAAGITYTIAEYEVDENDLSGVHAAELLGIPPELFAARDFHVDIETRGKHTLGMTVADLRFWKPNVSANMDLDRKGFVKLLMDACDSYPK